MTQVQHLEEDLLLRAINEKTLSCLQSLDKTDMICLARSLAELHALRVVRTQTEPVKMGSSYRNVTGYFDRTYDPGIGNMPSKCMYVSMTFI
jgi:hypothetical protein